jgi:DUF4097 and DUF4098 domain-containing protein YvlB
MRKTASFLLVATTFAVQAAAGVAQDDGVRVRAVDRVVVQEPRPRVVVQRRDGREEQTETLKRTVKLGSSGELDVSNISGNIEIKRGGGSEATIDIVKIARARTVEEAKEMLPLVTIDISERANRAEVRTVYPAHGHIVNNRRNVNVTVNYTITAPAGTRVSARSISGSLRASEITGDLSLSTTSGDVGVVKGRRVSGAKTTSGTVTISDTESDIALEAASVSGDVLFHRVRAPRMELTTVSGKVVLQDVNSDRIEAHSLSGDVEFSGPMKKGGRYELNSHSGNVKVAVSDGGFEVEANSFSGNVQADVPISGAGVQSAGGRFTRRKELKGVVGDGSAILEITTFSGNVIITKR